jgi:hypothetical protein
MVVLGACADQKGALMLAVSTDMKAPKDVNAVSVTISTNGAIKHSFIGRVTPQGEVLLPATLAIVEPEDKSASIRIRVMAFQERKPRVLRDVRTTVPSGGRTALLRIPLNFVNDAMVVGPSLPDGIVPDPIPGTGGGAPSGTTGGGDTGGGAFGSSAADFDFMNAFQPPCPNIQDDTVIDGACADNYVDPEALPDFDASLIGDSTDKDQCFEVGKCFAGATMIGESSGTSTGDGGTASDGGTTSPDPRPDASAVDAGMGFKDFRPQAVTLDRATCTVQLNGANPERLNLALVTPDTGECVRPGECYIPIDHGDAGWKEQNGRVQLPLFVCRLLGGKNVRLATSADTCAAKQESNPICAEKPIVAQPGGEGCAGFGKAWCEKLSSCGYLEFVSFGDTQSCAKVLGDYCTVTHAAPGATPVTAECNATFDALTCEQVNTFNELFGVACYVNGTLPDASPCQFNEQCSSGQCDGAIDSEGKCGTCKARVPAGGDCSGGDCVLGFRCIDSKCVQPAIVREGDDCSTPERRECFRSECVNGKCVAYLPEGAPCGNGTGPSCNTPGGYHCSSFDTDTPVCKKITFTSQVGAPCGRNGVDCAYGLSCKTNSDTTQPGTCVTDSALGQSCDTALGVDCAGFASCVNNVCTAPDAFRCNPK